MKPALLMIDLQMKFYDDLKHAQPLMNMAMQYMNAASQLFRAYDLPVIVIKHMSEAEGFVSGVDGFEFHPDIQIEETDIVIHKTKASAFIDTDLEKILKEKGIDTLIITGIAAEYCAMATYYGALERDFFPVYLKNGVAPAHPDIMDTLYKFMESVSISYLTRCIRG